MNAKSAINAPPEQIGQSFLVELITAFLTFCLTISIALSNFSSATVGRIFDTKIGKNFVSRTWCRHRWCSRRKAKNKHKKKKNKPCVKIIFGARRVGRKRLAERKRKRGRDMTKRKAIWVEKKWIDGKGEVKVIVGTASGKRKGYERRRRNRKSEIIGQRRMKRWIKEEGRKQKEERRKEREGLKRFARRLEEMKKNKLKKKKDEKAEGTAVPFACTNEWKGTQKLSLQKTADGRNRKRKRHEKIPVNQRSVRIRKKKESGQFMSFDDKKRARRKWKNENAWIDPWGVFHIPPTTKNRFRAWQSNNRYREASLLGFSYHPTIISEPSPDYDWSESSEESVESLSYSVVQSYKEAHSYNEYGPVIEQWDSEDEDDSEPESETGPQTSFASYGSEGGVQYAPVTSEFGRYRCVCRCGCRRLPGRRIECPVCLYHVGPGCCWSDESSMCHRCALDEMDNGESRERSQLEEEGYQGQVGMDGEIEVWEAGVAMEIMSKASVSKQKGCLIDRNRKKYDQNGYYYDLESEEEGKRRRSKSVPRKRRRVVKVLRFHESTGKSKEEESELVGEREYIEDYRFVKINKGSSVRDQIDFAKTEWDLEHTRNVNDKVLATCHALACARQLSEEMSSSGREAAIALEIDDGPILLFGGLYNWAPEVSEEDSSGDEIIIRQMDREPIPDVRRTKIVKCVTAEEIEAMENQAREWIESEQEKQES